ncbi:phosphoglycolate phosphatase [Psychrobacter sp. CCUG 69069]|uniref:Phosphoglycolate phosphatase n=1 Tax=Psychrobacter namhaensis TaxID=292734 RepID=A0ABW8L7Z0_9GAMM|nr:phosphoglycolate phosphatase [Psychrobacter sp. CCUG 69069]MCD1279855.1 phosphoglycolate phosphatase [Psychrobacter sp. CCUG 69069]
MTIDNKKLLIFDFDGTLIDSVPDLADAANIMLGQLGKPSYPIDTIQEWVGNGSRMLVERALSGSIEVDPHLSDAEVEAAERLFFDAYAAHDTSKTSAYPDVETGLKQLTDAGFTLALVTNKPIRFVPDILASLGWTSYFAMVLGGDSLSVKKPDPAPLLHVCETLQFDPTQALMIGDSINDIQAGKRANIDTVGLSYGYNYGKDIRDSQPNQAFDSFKALLDWVLK